MFILSLFFFLFMYLLLILGIAFLTLFERFLLGLSHQRLGPMKVSFSGILQPVFDGLKLFNKGLIFPFYSYNLFFFFIPVLSFFILFLEWLTLPFMFFFFNLNYSILFFLCLVGFLVYLMLLSGVFSKSKYSFLGSIRSSSQSVSFEVVFFFFIFIYMFYIQGLVFFSFFNFSFFFCFLFFLFLVLAELNRAPFDFSEGESELVSGFNLEYSSILFVLFFLSEYGFLIFFSVFFSFVFFFFSYIIIFFFLAFFILIRSSFPRYRYDLLMGFFWLYLLPLSMILFFFYFFFLF